MVVTGGQARGAGDGVRRAGRVRDGLEPRSRVRTRHRHVEGLGFLLLVLNDDQTTFLVIVIPVLFYVCLRRNRHQILVPELDNI
jgi:hypothetical protein